jgi:quercetin dioxygenase-like cupin family protein
MEAIHPGDVVWISPGEEHWHGAQAKTSMTHTTVQELFEGKTVDWLEHVSDAEYGSGV